MKHKILTAGMAVFAAMLVHKQSIAQPTLVSPSLADINWVTGGLKGINTALIDVRDTATDDKNYPLRQLGVCAYDGSGGGVIVTDFRSGCTVNVTFPVAGGSGFSMASTPDVIVGNKSGSNKDFIMAVAFVNTSMPAARKVEVDYFDIHYTSYTTFTVSLHSYETISCPAGDSLLRTVHIDVVAQSSNLITAAPGIHLPYCNPFFLTYDVADTATAGANNFRVYATYGSLNAYTALTQGPKLIDFGSCTFGLETWQPDVAGVEREIPAGSGHFHMVACLTYVMAQGAGCTKNVLLMYSEWDTYPGATCSDTLNNYTYLDGLTGSFPCATYSDFRHPRIDANDDYNTNGGSCQSKVVSEYTPAGGTIPAVHIYSPLLSLTAGVSTSWIDLTGLPGGVSYSAPYYHYAPAIAYGQNGHSEYMVTECDNIPGTGDFFVMNPIGTACGDSLSLAPASAMVRDYFVVDSSYPVTSSNHANSVSTPCNYVTDTSIAAWTNSGHIYYKRSGYNPTAGSHGYAYRITPTTVTGISTRTGIEIYPNPSDGTLVISNPNNATDRYVIKNILGQELMHGSLANGEQQINLGSIASGYYLISFYKQGSPACIGRFIKK